MRGNNYIEEHFNFQPDFSNVKAEELKVIENLCDKFYISFKNQELKEFKNAVSENINQNFKIIIENFIYYFGKDFFNRLLKYNGIESIQSLYNNLKYSLNLSIAYYAALSTLQLQKGSNIHLPEDMKMRILTLNNLYTNAKSKNIQIISLLNSKMDLLFEDTKNYIVEKYINEMKNDPNILLNLDKNITTIIGQILNGNRENFEEQYLNLMNNFIKVPFVEEYSKIINKEINDMNYILGKTIEERRVDLDKIFTLNTDNVLSDIENKLNNTLKAIELYNLH